jgi:GntR family transcriptional regulator, transcriptional repressor for pyruvate dehydrogenase complex
MPASTPPSAAAGRKQDGGGAPGAVNTSILGAMRARSHATLSDGVADQIQQLILRGDLKTGDRLPTELELADALGVSRSVIRDAMRALSAKGLVAVRQGHGTVVALPTSGAYTDSMVALLMRADLTIGDVIAARATLEAELAPLVTERGTEEDWDAMQLYLDQFAAAVRDGDWEAAHEAHFQFHMVPYRALRLPALELILTPLQQSILLTSLPPTRPGDTRGDIEAGWEIDIHPPILAAMRARDPTAAREAMKVHFAVFFTDAYNEFNSLPFRTAAELDQYYAYREQTRI